jgi:hypothetical protein
MAMLAALLFVRAIAQVGSEGHERITDVTGQQVHADMSDTVHAAGAQNDDNTGRSVGISGNSVIAGGWKADGGVGAAFVFTRAADGTYALTQKLGPELDGTPECEGDCNFGLYQAVKGNVAVMGAMRGGGGATPDQSGVAFVYERAEGSDTWTYKAKLTAEDAHAGDKFGCSFGISEDGNTIAVGAYQAACRKSDGTLLDINETSPEIEPSSCGAAYAFVKGNDGAWTQQAKFVGDDTANGDRYGWAVDLSGDVVVVGAARHNGRAGALYVYARTGTDWALEKKIAHHEHTDGATEAQADEDDHHFGRDVGISGCESDATCTILTGTPDEKRESTHSGVGYLFVRGANKDWALQGEIAHSGVSNANWTDPDPYGGSRHAFSQSVSISGDYALISASGDQAEAGGAAFVFHRTGTTWTEIERLVSTDGEAGMSFGRAVAIDGSSCNVWAVAGSPSHTQGEATKAGSADIYQIAKCSEDGVDSLGYVASLLAGWLLLSA